MSMLKKGFSTFNWFFAFKKSIGIRENQKKARLNWLYLLLQSFITTKSTRSKLEWEFIYLILEFFLLEIYCPTCSFKFIKNNQKKF